MPVPPAHAGGDEHHVDVPVDQPFNLGNTFLCCCRAHFGTSAGTESSAEFRAQEHLCGCVAQAQGLKVGVEGDEFNATDIL